MTTNLKPLTATVLSALAVTLGGPSGLSGQELPPEVQADLYLVRAERQIESQDYVAALESLDVVLALQANYDMETPVGLWFRHAQVALNARYPQTAIGSVTRYLQEAGREGEHYRAALALLDEAQSQVEGVETPAPTPLATPAQTPARTPQAPAPAPAAESTETESGAFGGRLTVLFPWVGVNAANMSFTSSGPLAIDSSPLTGIAGGIAVAFPLGYGPFGVQLGAQYAQKGARIDLGTTDAPGHADISFQGMDFMALARISPPPALDLPLYALVGPYASFELDCRVAVEASQGTGRFNASDDCGNANLDTQSLDFGISGGVGFEMGTGATRITLGLLYSYGFQDIDKLTTETVKHRVLNIHAGVATKF